MLITGASSIATAQRQRTALRLAGNRPVQIGSSPPYARQGHGRSSRLGALRHAGAKGEGADRHGAGSVYASSWLPPIRQAV